MKRIAIGLTVCCLLATFVVGFYGVTRSAAGSSQENDQGSLAERGKATVPLKDAKLNIEHNATDSDTGFQGFIDSEGWKRLDVRGPEGTVLSFQGRGELAKLGLTELFFETVEPANADVPIDEMLAKLPEGNYNIQGPGIENGERTGSNEGTAWLTHDIPAGPKTPLASARRDGSQRGPGRTLGCGQQDHHRSRSHDHRLPTDHREGRTAAPAHDREDRAEHVRPGIGDQHRRPEWVSRTCDGLQVGSPRH